LKIEVEIPISDGVLDEGAKDRVQRAALEAIVLRLFDERRITAVEAAEDLGLTRVQFMELTRSRGVPQHDYTSDDLAADLADLDSAR
jgi:predicted HTH domain antitoxin